MFDIRNYMWDVFRLNEMETSEKGLSISLDKFIANINNFDNPNTQYDYHRKELGLDWAAIRAEGAVKNQFEFAARNQFNAIMKTSKEDLMEAFAKGDKQAFNKIVFG